MISFDRIKQPRHGTRANYPVAAESTAQAMVKLREEAEKMNAHVADAAHRAPAASRLQSVIQSIWRKRRRTEEAND